MLGKLSVWYRDSVSGELDCLGCRLVSGVGLLGIGAFIFSHSKRPRAIENITMKSLAAAVAFLGVARLADANFLKAEQRKQAEDASSRR